MTDKRKIELLLHTTGLRDPYCKESYRNHFVACGCGDDIPMLLVLCNEGLMEEVTPPGFLPSSDRVFRATACGMAVAKAHQPRRTRAQRRYHDYLNARDAWPDLTFHEFLTAKRQKSCGAPQD